MSIKLIRSVVRPHKVEDVKKALNGLGVYDVTAREVRDYSPQKHPTDVWRGTVFTLGYSVKTEIAIIVHDDDVDEVVKAIICTARTGQPGDGDISVRPVDHRYDIRTGERCVG
jgi:nitrogen regulatory protein P-II 1